MCLVLVATVYHWWFIETDSDRQEKEEIRAKQELESQGHDDDVIESHEPITELEEDMRKVSGSIFVL